jgi:hypothetical protein
MRLRLVSRLIDAATRRYGRAGTPADARPPAPTGPPLDQQRVVQVGDVLQSCYPERDETLDGTLTALMLQLTVEPHEPRAPRKR